MPRTALVTGASRGIGLACARALAQAGHRVVLAARDQARLEQAASEIPNSSWVRIDMTSAESIREAFAQAGKIDILVNNAGAARDGLALRMKKDAWDEVLAANLTGAFLAVQQVLHGMLKERWGRIVNISSVVGEAGNPGQANYVASKAGLIGLTKSLAQELGSRNITVNAIAPGFIESDMTASLSQELKESMLSRIPVKRFGQPDDVAAAVRFLASEEAGYITGHVLRVNGGMYM
jgi:3-oxoacyl-[acyl-carrier protein] reductase